MTQATTKRERRAVAALDGDECDTEKLLNRPLYFTDPPSPLVLTPSLSLDPVSRVSPVSRLCVKIGHAG